MDRFGEMLEFMVSLWCSSLLSLFSFSTTNNISRRNNCMSLTPRLHFIIAKDQDAFKETACLLSKSINFCKGKILTVLRTSKVIFRPGLVATTGKRRQVSNNVFFSYPSSILSNSGKQLKMQRKLVNPIFSTLQLRCLVPIF